jgi:hypothetical protein
VNAPVHFPSPPVQVLLAAALEVGDLQENTAGDTRPQTDSIRSLEVRPACRSSPGTFYFLRSQRFEFFRQQLFEIAGTGDEKRYVLDLRFLPSDKT